MNVGVRYAKNRFDLEACFDLRREAEDWLAQRGIEQWTNHHTGRAGLTTAYEHGTLYVATSENRIVGCFSIAGPDFDFWTSEEARFPAKYLYKLIITQGFRGTGLGDALIDYACQRSHQLGARALRMDCWKTNTGLQKYYLDRGFEHLTTRTAPGRSSGWLAQRDVRHRTNPPGVTITPEPDLTRPGDQGKHRN